MRTVHETMSRLYLAAKELRQASRPAHVARLLNISQQTLKNWEERGMSSEGILRAAEVLGCRPIWLAKGTGDMADGGGHGYRKMEGTTILPGPIVAQCIFAGRSNRSIATTQRDATMQWVKVAIAHMVEIGEFDITVSLDEGRYRVKVRPETEREG